MGQNCTVARSQKTVPQRRQRVRRLDPDLLPESEGWRRRIADMCAAVLADLGGEPNTSVLERKLI